MGPIKCSFLNATLDHLGESNKKITVSSCICGDVHKLLRGYINFQNHSHFYRSILLKKCTLCIELAEMPCTAGS